VFQYKKKEKLLLLQFLINKNKNDKQNK
jgi:hypothetical protein